MRVKLIFVLIFTAFIFYIGSSVNASNGTLSYLPREERLETTSMTYSGSGRRLNHITCGTIDELARQLNECLYCTQHLKAQCPDCCLNLGIGGAGRSKKCSSGENVLYAGVTQANGCASSLCTVPAFDAATCSEVSCGTLLTTCNYSSTPYTSSNLIMTGIPCGQYKGCPTGEPDISNTSTCQQDAVNPGEWICDEKASNVDNLNPKNNCTVQNNSCSDCSVIRGYTYEGEEVCPPGIPGPECYRYKQNAGLTTCLTNCSNYGLSWETFSKQLYCCKQRVCSGSNACANGTGDDICCPDSTACAERIAWSACDSLTAQSCINLQNQIAACVQGGSGGSCSGCFVQIDPTFKYDFVARSNDKLVVVWQVEASPGYTPASAATPRTDFYTMVKIFEAKDDGTIIDPTNPVHESIVHQKSFVGSFSIYSATSTAHNARTGNEVVFTAGQKYTIRLYYFLPKITGYTLLYSDISRLGFTILRIRE